MPVVPWISRAFRKIRSEVFGACARNLGEPAASFTHVFETRDRGGAPVEGLHCESSGSQPSRILIFLKIKFFDNTIGYGVKCKKNNGRERC